MFRKPKGPYVKMYEGANPFSGQWEDYQPEDEGQSMSDESTAQALAAIRQLQADFSALCRYFDIKLERVSSVSPHSTVRCVVNKRPGILANPKLLTEDLLRDHMWECASILESIAQGLRDKSGLKP